LARSWQIPLNQPNLEENGAEVVQLTTSQLLGLSNAERNAAINTIAGEAFQGGDGKDIAAVAANLISRRFSPKYGGNIVDIVRAPGQYAANFQDAEGRVTTPVEQITGRGLISDKNFDRIATIFDNASMVRNAIVQGNAPLQFRGTQLYKNMKPTDYVPVPGKSNFYFDPASDETRDNILSKLGSDAEIPVSDDGNYMDIANGAVDGVDVVTDSTQPFQIVINEAPVKTVSFEDKLKGQLIGSMISDAMRPSRTSQFLTQYLLR
jgi:hypothetical protein